MNDTQEKQQAYTYFEHENQQQNRNDDDIHGDYFNPFHKQGSYEFQLSSSNFESKKGKKLTKPPLGAPGGLDDPNRAGLSIPHIRWYLRFLNQGFSADEAIKKTYERIECRTQRKLRKTARAAAATSAASSEIYEDSLSSTSSSSNMQSFKTDLNPETSAKDLLKLANESGRHLDECLEYCRLYQFKGNNKKLFLNLYHEQGLGLDYSLQKTLEASKRKIHKRVRIESHGSELWTTCLKYRFKGAHKNWFFRLVKEDGFTVEEATNIVQKQIAETGLLVKQKGNNSEYNKTNRERELKTVATQHRKYDTSGAPPVSDCEKLQLRVGILPKNYPQHKLDEEALRLLEDAVIEEVARGWEANLQFKGINFGAGVLLVDCGNTETAQWLTFVAPQLNAWSGVDLIACLEDDLPMPHTASMYLLSSAGQSVTTSLALFNSQNAGLNTRVWKLIDCRDEGNDQRITFGIDKISFDTIIANGNIIHYRFGTIPVQISGAG